MASDACESRGLEVVKLSDETQRALLPLVPAEASVRNPVDMIASASATAYERCLRVLLDAPEVDMVLVVFVTPIVTDAGDVASAILAGAKGSSKTVATCFMGRRGVPEAVRSLRDGRYPSYAFPESAAAALARAARYGQRGSRRPRARSPRSTSIDRERPRRPSRRRPSRAGSRPQRCARCSTPTGCARRARSSPRPSTRPPPGRRRARRARRAEARLRHHHAQERRGGRGARAPRRRGRARGLGGHDATPRSAREAR